MKQPYQFAYFNSLTIRDTLIGHPTLNITSQEEKTKGMKIIISLFICFLLILSSCNTSKMTFGNADKWLPADFKPSGVTLLIEKTDGFNKTQRKMEEYMATKYPYEYEFASKSEIEMKGGKYSDLKRYKFAIVYSSERTVMPRSGGYSTGGSGQFVGAPGLVGVTGFDFNFIDRETGRRYPPTKRASSYPMMTFRPVINTIVERFK